MDGFGRCGEQRADPLITRDSIFLCPRDQIWIEIFLWHQFAGKRQSNDSFPRGRVDASSLSMQRCALSPYLGNIAAISSADEAFTAELKSCRSPNIDFAPDCARRNMLL